MNLSGPDLRNRLEDIHEILQDVTPVYEVVPKGFIFCKMAAVAMVTENV